MKNLLLILLIFFSFHMAVPGQKPELNMLRAVAFMEQNRYDSALLSLQQINNQKFPDLKEMTGTCYLKLKQPQEALSSFLGADSTKPSYAYNLAQCYASLGNNQTALAWLEKYLIVKNKKSEYEIKSDTIFRQLNKTPAWRKIWLVNHYSESETEINAVSSLIGHHQPQEALEEMDKYGSKIFPKHALYILKAKAYAMQNLNNQALEEANKAIDLYKRSDNYFKTRAEALAALKKFGEASEDMTKSILLNPYKPKYYLQRATYERQAGNISAAKSDMDIYSKLYPDAPETYYELGQIESAQGNHLNALRDYSRLLELDNSKPEYFMLHGNTAMKVRRPETADLDFGMALDLDPSLPDAWLNKGKIRLMQGDSSACYFLDMAKKNGSAEAARLMYENCK